MMMKVGDLIECQIIGFQDYGIFVSFEDYEGLVHISEISEQFVSKLEETFHLGERLLLIVLEVDKVHKRLKLSYKQNHKIHPKILKEVSIVRGFCGLKNELETWISNEKELETDEET